MSISTYAELQTAVEAWLHRDNMTAIIPDLIVLGEVRIFDEVRCRQMETALSGTIASGVVAVPSDYLELKNAYIVSGANKKRLARATPDLIYKHYPQRSADSLPSTIAREGSNFIFGPYPDSGYTIGGIYYAKPTSIVTSANALFTESPDLYLWAALCEAMPYIGNDKRFPLWEQKYQQAKARIEKQNADEEISGGALMMRVG